MSMDKPNVLSQWRAYGQDGRGVALTLDAYQLGRLVQNVPMMRISSELAINLSVVPWQS
jgi:hypothetical protein